MNVEMFVLVVCLIAVTSAEMTEADVKDRLKRLLLNGEFERSESNSNCNESSGSKHNVSGGEQSGSGSEPDGNYASSGSGSGYSGSGGESSGSGSESSGSGSESSGSGNPDCFGTGNKEKLKNLSAILHWMNDEYSNEVLEEDFAQLQGIQELIAYLIVVEEHREYAEASYLARRMRGSGA
ncbi:uncharacterized protein LOC132738704 [Ruditapes philippinarum]|uniref:uncharacterized protein LOC132738704 n=1 Tax=Ruditapes philippinarum TaxID=129788 RepID=UPI00295AFAC0|nr:uncharacterized protein LOC132738704 [Ruditapes philippinarum]